MNIAMIGHKRVPGREGGVEVVVEELTGQLTAMGHTVTLYNRAAKGTPKCSEYAGARIVTVPTVNKKSLDAVIYSFLATLHALFGGYNVIHYHALLRRAFQQAFKEERIDANPFDRVGRPKKNKFHGENYTQEELLTLLHLARGDVIYPAILLAGAMGLRRSEALGVRWSRIDWEKRTVLLDTKIVEYRENGKKKVEPVEEMKNKSSRRTLPLPDPVVEMLQVQKEHREVYRKMFQGSYNAQYLDYVCVNQLGELLRPSYVTDHFRELLEKYGLRHIRFHDLRHTFASLLINQDVPLINVSNFLGHSDLSTTANIYAHLDKASKQASAAVISDILQGENRHAQPKGEPETNTDRQT